MAMGGDDFPDLHIVFFDYLGLLLDHSVPKGTKHKVGGGAADNTIDEALAEAEAAKQAQAADKTADSLGGVDQPGSLQ
ncbi:unnamed protein product [Cyprideis torosa]|uniref:Uncharacterized protein n=1 Tax=Cyprideis torosa TaxID=163714 RepID=A0A7R8ZW16_9CRUS|nr:unnamed protein product [Cyprideis torosa]CAG0903983.1 unnamed protein product [Cyprideis torosa]